MEVWARDPMRSRMLIGGLPRACASVWKGGLSGISGISGISGMASCSAAVPANPCQAWQSNDKLFLVDRGAAAECTVQYPP
jgi:hypothetical protein